MFGLNFEGVDRALRSQIRNQVDDQNSLLSRHEADVYPGAADGGEYDVFGVFYISSEYFDVIETLVVLLKVQNQIHQILSPDF